MGTQVRRRRARGKAPPAEPAHARIESLSHDGRGVARVEGKTVFVWGGLPGEEVLFHYTRQRRTHDEGIVCEIIEPSPDRVPPRCPHFGVCGGCSLQHMRTEAQIPLKQGVLIEALKRIGKVEPREILPPLSAENPWGYRRKARLGVKYVAKKNKVLVGFRERGSAFVTDLSRCEVLNPRVGELITPLGQLIGDLSVRDRIPQVEMSMGDEICVLVFRILDSLSTEDEGKLESFGRAHKIAIYLQEAGPASVRPLCDEAVGLGYRLPEFQVRCSFAPNDFTQINLDLNRLMVHRAVQLLDPQPDEDVLELFCGLGNFTLPLARRAAQVTGVEGDAGLVARARANARANGIGNARFYTANLYGDLDLEPWLQGTCHKILLDPPRTGALEVMHCLARVQARRVLYVSCNPATLARDADELVNNLGYRLAAAGVMDMFPHTAHVESMALFEKTGS